MYSCHDNPAAARSRDRNGNDGGICESGWSLIVEKAVWGTETAALSGGTVEENDQVTGSKGFGGYLRGVRESRRLSLDAVEEMSAGFPERITKSHLSRIENGLAYPTFTRLFALSRIYGVPISSMAERFDIALQRQMAPPATIALAPHEALAEGKKLAVAGRYAEALALFSAILDAHRAVGGEGAGAGEVLDLRLGYMDCLFQLGRYEFAKTEAEEVLSQPRLSDAQRMLAFQTMIICCYRLGRYTVAMMALDQALREAERTELPPKVLADLETIRGNVLVSTGRVRDALPAYRKALDLHERVPNRFEACRVRINLGAALAEAGDRDGARECLDKALAESESSGYDRLRASALSFLAVVAFEAGDQSAAEAFALRSNAVARPREYLSIVFRNCFYLWKIARSRNDEAGVRTNERTLRAYVGRIEEQMPEVEAYRAFSTGGEA